VRRSNNLRNVNIGFWNVWLFTLTLTSGCTSTSCFQCISVVLISGIGIVQIPFFAIAIDSRNHNWSIFDINWDF
jgi:hypothetical protein